MEHTQTAADADTNPVTITVKSDLAQSAKTNGASEHPDLSVSTTTSPDVSQYSQNGGAQATSPASEQRAPKIAACLSCRRSKVRCEKGADPERCRRCVQTGSECVRPTFNVGRRKGVKK